MLSYREGTSVVPVVMVVIMAVVVVTVVAMVWVEMEVLMVTELIAATTLL
jgi:hypothetical protein